MTNPDIETVGKEIGQIPVEIDYRIIELFSAGLYSSPNKAFEELVCNSYDAMASKVAVFIPDDLTVDGQSIWVCDNGESMDEDELTQLWKIGSSLKREDHQKNEKRPQIGRFGIGKLSTYILTHKLSYLCKKNNRFLSVTMDYSLIGKNQNKELKLKKLEITEEEAKKLVNSKIGSDYSKLIDFDLFGQQATTTWTLSILSNLKPKALEIQQGRLKWILSTALPLSPGFSLILNGKKIESSKANKPLIKTWVIGSEDKTAEKSNATCKTEKDKYFIDLPNLKNVHGEFSLYEDSLAGEKKSDHIGRSHGIFLMVRNRLINLDDALLGMEAFSHGAFNRCRITVHADELDENLASTREVIKESEPFRQLKEYIKKKFNNEVKTFYFERENKKEQQNSIGYRMSKTSLTISKKPLLSFVRNFYNKEIVNPFLIQKPEESEKEQLISRLEEELSSEESFIKEVKWDMMDISAPIAKLVLSESCLHLNLLHPYIANYIGSNKGNLPLQYIAIVEVLTEAHLYDLGIDEQNVNNIMKRRDRILRELSLSDRNSAPLVANILRDSLADPTGLENAVHQAFLSLGFESVQIGDNGEPDGLATAFLGYSPEKKQQKYSLTFDAKSTKSKKIAANTANLATIKKHQNAHNADFALVVSIDYEGYGDETSSINTMAKQQQITVMKATDLIRLLLLSVPKQLGLKKIKELFDNCYAPIDVTKWIDKIEETPNTPLGPIKEVLEVIYELQKEDTESPNIAAVRWKVKDKIQEEISTTDVKTLLDSLKRFIPGFIHIEGDVVGINGTPEKIMNVISEEIGKNITAGNMTEIYLKAFRDSEDIL